MTSREEKGGGGVESYLSPAEGNEIVNCLKVMERNGFWLSREEVLDFVHLYLKQNNNQYRLFKVCSKSIVQKQIMLNC